MAIREGAWDCPHCGQKRNRGPEKHCPSCGSARGPEVKFYLPEGAAEVTDPAALARAKAGPDWSCRYCDTDNPAGYAFCSSCGASSAGAPHRPVVEHRFKAEPPPEPKKLLEEKRRKVKRKSGCCSGCTLVVLLLFLGLVIFSRIVGPTEDVVVVEGHHWERTVEVETRVTETRSDWEGGVPAGARILGRERALHHNDSVQIGTETKRRTRTEKVQTGTEKVQVGVRDLGNGYFEDIYEDRPVYEERTVEETYEAPVYRKDPVYKMRFTYEIDLWKKARDKVLSGNDVNPVWPKLGVGEREGKRQELYEVLFRDSKGRARSLRVGREEAWRDFDVGARFRAEISGGRKVKKILGPA